MCDCVLFKPRSRSPLLRQPSSAVTQSHAENQEADEKGTVLRSFLAVLFSLEITDQHAAVKETAHVACCESDEELRLRR